MNIEKIPVTQLKAAEYNPRKDLQPGDAEYEKLKRSIETFGYTLPVVWNKTTGNVVGGHQRLKVLKDLGYTEIECAVVELDSNNEKALNVALNKISGEWDEEKLSELINELSASELDVTLTGFDAPDIETLIRGSRLNQLKEDEFDIAGELGKPAVCRSGDVWLLGRHHLICGSGAKQYIAEQLMDGQQANLLVTVVPVSTPQEVVKNTLTATAQIITDDASVYIIHEDTDSINCRQAFADAGFYLSGTCIWERPPKKAVKNAAYMNEHAPVLFGWKKGGKHRWYADRKQTTLWGFKPSNGHSIPVALMGYPILNSSMTNGVVYDPFGGYGETLLACEQTGRICYTLESQEKNCDVIVQRYITLTGDASSVFLIRGGETTPYAEINEVTE